MYITISIIAHFEDFYLLHPIELIYSFFVTLYEANPYDKCRW